MSNLIDVMELWEKDRDFREGLLKNPSDDFLRSKKIELNPNDLKKVIAMVELQVKRQDGFNIDLEKKINK